MQLFAMDMSHCDYSEDELGKRYPVSMNHEMDESLNQLRISIPSLKKMTNGQIMGMMKMMGPNYYWPIVIWTHHFHHSHDLPIGHFF